MERRFTLDGGGSLTVQEEGLRAVMTAERPVDGKGLYKAYLRGPAGRALLGTLAPEGGRLVVKRRLTVDGLKRQGAWPPVGGEVELAFPFETGQPPQGWNWTEPGELSFGEPLLARMAARQGRVLCRRMGEGFALAYPFSCGRPFPLPALFCLARVASINGGSYVLFHFGEDGWPRLPAGAGGAGVC